MDGTGRLFAPLVGHLSSELRPRIVSFPPDRPRTYDELLGELEVPDGPFAIVAESFSGPLGMRLAARHPDRVRALILVATFVRNPSRLAGWLQPLLGPRLFRWRPPDVALRLGLLGMDAGDDQVSALRAALLAVNPDVMAQRLREIVAVDVRHELAALAVPISYISGTRDRLLGPRIVRELRRLRPDMQTHALDAPHLVLQRRPVEAAKLISEILKA